MKQRGKTKTGHKRSKRILAWLFMGVLALSLMACGREDQVVRQYLSYSAGMDERGNYNSALYSLNGTDIVGADPQVIFVSKEQSEEYGGYYYMYYTGWYKADRISNEHEGTKMVAFPCFRSENLSEWEPSGCIEGHSLQVMDEDWCESDFWAPEVMYNAEEKLYYMYYSASMPKNYGVEDFATYDAKTNNCCLGVAVSETPIGPFRTLYDIDEETGKRIPTFNLKAAYGSKDAWSIIDISPFVDDDGTMYVYFNHHQYIYGMKMLDMTTPDYSTLACLAAAGYQTVSYEPGGQSEIVLGEPYYDDESNCNEGPFMYKHNGKYYLTYSSNGYGHVDYSIHQAISDSPLSGFVKVNHDMGNPVLDGSKQGYVTGTGHHCFVEAGDDLWIVYHRHTTVNNGGAGRSICADRVRFATNAEGQEVMTANGPSFCPQWLPEEVSGYKNLAPEAKITVSTGEGVEYLNDEITPYYEFADNKVLRANGELTVTMTWNQPITISSLMIYNACSINSAFSQISRICFKTTETLDGKPLENIIDNLIFPTNYYNTETFEYMRCCPAVAEFEPLTITEIVITISAEDRLVNAEDIGGVSGDLELSEIVVLGGTN